MSSKDVQQACERIQAIVDKTFGVPMWKPGGTIACAEGHTVSGFDGQDYEPTLIKLLEKHGENAVFCEECRAFTRREDIGIWRRKPPRASTVVQIDISDAQILLAAIAESLEVPHV